MSIIKYLKNNNLTDNEMYINMDFCGKIIASSVI